MSQGFRGKASRISEGGGSGEGHSHDKRELHVYPGGSGREQKKGCWQSLSIERLGVEKSEGGREGQD